MRVFMWPIEFHLVYESSIHLCWIYAHGNFREMNQFRRFQNTIMQSNTIERILFILDKLDKKEAKWRIILVFIFSKCQMLHAFWCFFVSFIIVSSMQWGFVNTKKNPLKTLLNAAQNPINKSTSFELTIIIPHIINSDRYVHMRNEKSK